MTRVLVVDDDGDLRTTLVELLGEGGYQALGASDGREALTELRRSHVDVVLLDVMMPGMNAIEFRREQLLDAELARPDRPHDRGAPPRASSPRSTRRACCASRSRR